MAFFCVTVVCIFNYSSKCFLFFENSPQVHCFVFPLSTIMNYGTSNIRSGVGLQYIFMHNKIHNVTQDMNVCVCVQSRPTLCDPMDCSPPSSLLMGFSMQEYLSGVPFPSPGDLPDPEIKPGSPR